MPQLRLTAKFAHDIKVNNLEEPDDVLPVVDDWVIDAIRVNRKKVALVTHVATKISFLIPYADVGGAKNIPYCIALVWEALLREEDLDSLAEQVENVFSRPIKFCKTNDRSVLGFMNDFKHTIEHMGARGDELDDIESLLHETPINLKSSGFSTPMKLLHTFASK